MKEIKKNSKKLTNTDIENMWGGDGPYSQVSLHEQTRILDDSVSRVFLVVEAEINPFTFEYVKKNRKKFENDEAVIQLLNHAEYRGKFGYVVGAGEVEVNVEGARGFAEEQRDVTIQTLIRMHKFIIDEFNLQKVFGFIGNDNSDKQFIWNDKEGKVEATGDVFFDSKTLIGSESGIKNNKMRFFFVIAFNKNFKFKDKTISSFINILDNESNSFRVEIESCESFMDYMLLTTLIPIDIPPAQFIESVIDLSNKINKKSIFIEKYFVSNMNKPTIEEIIDFLKEFN